MKPCKHKSYVENCRLCYLHATDLRYRALWSDHQIACTADGIGDALLGLVAVRPATHYALLGTNRKGAPWQEPFVKLFHKNCSTKLIPDIPTYYPHDTYDKQNLTRLQKPRWVHYAEACIVSPKLPKLLPLPQEAHDFAAHYRGVIVLAPFSHWTNRSWLLSHWIALEKLLVQRGRRCVILDGRTSDHGRTDVFHSPVLRDESAEKIAAVMLAADSVISNDSGQAHLGGMLQVPTVVLCGPIKGENIYGLYPTVKCINGPLFCSGCHWMGAHGWHKVCDKLCASLQMITPEVVAEVVENITCKSLLSPDRLATLRDSAKRTCHLRGVMGEFGVFKGGSARVIADACNKPLHLWDTFTGIPQDDEHGVHKAGDFRCSFDEVQQHLMGRNVVYHVGVFPETAVADLEFSFVHVDCDTYQSTRAAITYFYPRLVEGGHMVFDDVGWENTPGVLRAIKELLPDVQIERTAYIQGRIIKETGCCGGKKKRQVRPLL